MPPPDEAAEPGTDRSQHRDGRRDRLTSRGRRSDRHRIVEERDRRGGFESVDEAAMAAKCSPMCGRGCSRAPSSLSGSSSPDVAGQLAESSTSDDDDGSRCPHRAGDARRGSRNPLGDLGPRCSIGCADCCNPHTWDADAGTAFTTDDLIDQMLTAPVEGITLLGGEPFDQARRDGDTRSGRAARPGLGVMTFTGYRYEVLRRSSRPDWASLLAATDLLVDGPYLQDRRTPSGRGSARRISDSFI